MTATLRELGAAIREQRNLRHLTLADLGSLADLSAKHLGEIERGNVDLQWTTVSRIADALGSSVGELDALGENRPDKV